MTKETTPLIRDDHPRLYFVSDLHLGGSPEPRESTKRERFLALCRRVQTEGAGLFVLGDLFDFWFEYRTVVPRTAFGILAHLDTLARSGVRIGYLGGNHDFWLLDFLARETAIETLRDGTLLEAQGRRIRLFHGDGLGPGDHGYKVLKWALRSPIAIWLYRWIHPDLGIPLALRSSHLSRGHTRKQPPDPEDLYREVGLPVFRNGADSVLLGHHHLDLHWKREEGEFLILGDWFEKFTCVRLQDGQFQLLRWPL